MLQRVTIWALVGTVLRFVHFHQHLVLIAHRNSDTDVVLVNVSVLAELNARVALLRTDVPSAANGDARVLLYQELIRTEDVARHRVPVLVVLLRTAYDALCVQLKEVRRTRAETDVLYAMRALPGARLASNVVVLCAMSLAYELTFLVITDARLVEIAGNKTNRALPSRIVEELPLHLAVVIQIVLQPDLMQLGVVDLRESLVIVTRIDPDVVVRVGQVQLEIRATRVLMCGHLRLVFHASRALACALG